MYTYSKASPHSYASPLALTQVERVSQPEATMKTKSHSQSGSGSLPILVCAVASSILAGTLLAFLSPEAPAKVFQRPLTFVERVAYQRAIEEVYWRHRIWPKERPDPKPSLDVVMSQAQLENKVTDYLHNSQTLEEHSQEPITAEQLQAEMDRMAHHTRQPEVLLELFKALGNDPFVIAECLARPVLTERLIADGSIRHQTGHLEALRMAELQMPNKVAAIETCSLPSSLAAAHPGFTFYLANPSARLNSIAKAVQVNRPYQLPVIAATSAGCIGDTWTATSTTNAPDARDRHTAVWTGSEMIVWGGFGGLAGLNTGGRYAPSTDSWTPTSTTNAPSFRFYHSAVWTGSEMIVWGGEDVGTVFNTGGRYSPTADSWTPTSTINAPSGRELHTAVWTGSEMIVWGGEDLNTVLNTGGRYNPSGDSWTATSTTNAPSAREGHTAVWTGSEMIVWGGGGGGPYFNTGGSYNPDTDTWGIPTPITNAPEGRTSHTALWTGSEMIVWGGELSNLMPTNTGGRLGPNGWIPTSTTGAPSPRERHTAVLDEGSEMIVWGGFGVGPLNTGGRYNLNMDSWTATSTSNAPTARASHTAVSDDSEMIVWGGSGNFDFFNTGGRYCAQPGLTPTPSPTATPTATPSPCQFRVLIAYADISGQPDMLRDQILAEPNVFAVDYFDAFFGTPTLQQLQQYDIVVAFSNNVWNDPVAMGNVLADYEDVGGVVAVGTFAWDSNGGWLLQGRWVTGGYSPYNSTNQQNFTCDIANIIDPSHPLMQDVSSLSACVRNGLTLASAASAVALWTDAPPAVAYKPNNGHTAVGINAYLGHLGQFSGEFGRVIVNAGRWLNACASTPTPTPTATATTATATPTQTPRVAPTPRSRPTPAPRP